jgi:hypothetical protein
MNLQTRVKNILLQPASEWPVIAAESADVMGLYRNYIVILAAIPAVCQFLGMAAFFPVIALTTAIASYIIALVSAFIAALVIEKLAPNFGSSGDTTQALKAVAYASTPIWLAGVFRLVWFLGPLAGLIGGLYAIYLFYLGLTPVMKTPKDKVIPYMLVSALVIIVINLILFAVMAAMGLMGAGYGYGYRRMY